MAFQTGSVRRIASAVLATTALVAVSGRFGNLAAQAGRPAQAPKDPCAEGEPQARVAACTRLLDWAGLAPTGRVIALVNRGNALEELEQFDLALRDFQAALSLDAASLLALRSRAVALHRHGRSDEAMNDVTRAIAASPDDVTSLRLRAMIEVETGRIKNAVEDYSKVLDRNPADLSARQGRGMALAVAGDDVRAVQDFTRVLERDPRARMARAARAFSLFRTRQYGRAITDWDQLLKDDPAQLPVLYCRGAAKVLNGDESGRADMEAVRQQKPEVAEAQNAVCSVASRVP